MGKAKQTRKFAVAKKIISPKDTRVKENAEKAKKKKNQRKRGPTPVEQAVSALFFQYNTHSWDHPTMAHRYQFINFSIRYVIDARCCFLPISNYFFFLLTIAVSLSSIAGKKS
jgi:U3 small nucleolar RNA-associated protein 24